MKYYFLFYSFLHCTNTITKKKSVATLTFIFTYLFRYLKIRMLYNKSTGIKEQPTRLKGGWVGQYSWFESVFRVGSWHYLKRCSDSLFWNWNNLWIHPIFLMDSIIDNQWKGFCGRWSGFLNDAIAKWGHYCSETSYAENNISK